ncbi:MAG: hypothetical protein ACI4XI_04150 [Ruminococcus sp.]
MFEKCLEKAQKNNTIENDSVKYAKKGSFDAQLEAWDKITVGFSFIVGNTDGVLENIDLGNGKFIGRKQIRFDATKIKNILNKHNGMSINIFKRIPEILINPVVVAKSNTYSDRIVLLGDVYDDNEKLVIVVLELNPSSRSGESTYTNIIKIATAQGRSHIQSLLNNILYVDSNKNRVNQWLNVNRLQLPLRSTTTNSKIIISNSNENVKFSLREPVEQKKDLVAVHNLSEEKMMKSLSLGGLPMPSIAIAKAKYGHTEFGKISLVFPASTIDPERKSNQVY